MKIEKTIKLLTVFLGLMFSLSLSAEKLNVLLVMTDDQGYGDLSCNGNPYLSTPNIDKLAGESYNFTNYHTATTCAPTRSGLMSAMYCNKAGVWHTIMGRSLLDLKRETIAEVFHKGGYATAMFGKWHLGDNYPYRPFDRGFETTLWHKGGGIGQAPDYWGNSYFSPTLFNNNTPEKHEGFCTDIFFDNAIKFMKKSQDDGRPFFCYLALNAAHSPFNAPKEYEKKFKGNKKVPSAGFYGMIENIDDNMGKVEAFLKDNGLDKNTILIFTTDNGSTFGESYVGVSKKDKIIDISDKELLGYNAEMRGHKSEVWDGGHRVPFFMRIPSGQAVKVNQLMGYIDVAPTLIDICGLESMKDIDGISVKSVIDNPKSKIDRYLLGDTQRKELMSKDNVSVVMKDSWRLINRSELYDVSKDVGQRNDIAKDYPEVVAELLKEHDKYWDYIAPENEIMHPIYLSVPTGEEVVLNSHDRHVNCIYNQANLKKLGALTGESFWYVKAPEDGEYTFELLNAAPERKVGLDPSITGGKLIIGEKSMDAKLKNASVKFENVKLAKGDYKLNALFSMKKGNSGAYYVRITKK